MLFEPKLEIRPGLDILSASFETLAASVSTELL